MSSTLSPSTSLNNINNHKFPSSSSTRPTLLKTLNFPFTTPSKLTLISPKSSTTTNYELGLDEEMGRIKRLQNGSDVRGVAVEGEPGRKVDLTPPAVEAIAESFGEWVINGLVKEKGIQVEDVRVSLGRDPRISGGSLSVAIFSGLGRAGCITFDMGLATTPACFMSTVLSPFSYDASIMVLCSLYP